MRDFERQIHDKIRGKLASTVAGIFCRICWIKSLFEEKQAAGIRYQA